MEIIQTICYYPWKTSYFYNCSEGTWWVSHQFKVLKVRLENLPVMLHSQMKSGIALQCNNVKKKSQLEGVRRETSNLKLLIYQVISCDTKRCTVPCSLACSMFHVPCFMFHVPCSMFHFWSLQLNWVSIKNHFKARYPGIQWRNINFWTICKI